MSSVFQFWRKDTALSMTEGVSCTHLTARFQEKFVKYSEKVA